MQTSGIHSSTAGNANCEQGNASRVTSDVSRAGPGRYPAYVGVILPVLIGLYFCFVGRSNVLLFGDEFHSIQNLDKTYIELFRHYDSHGSGIALPVIQRLCVDLFGPGLFAYRLVAFVGAIGTLLIVYPVGTRFVGRTPAFISSVALATNPIHIFYSRFGRSYALLVLVVLALAYVVDKVLNQERVQRFWYAVLALLVGLVPYAHLMGAASVAGVGAGALVAMSCRRSGRKQWVWLLGSFAAGLLLCACLYLPALQSLRQYIAKTSGRGRVGEFGVLDVASLLVGTRAGGVFLVVAGCIGMAWIIAKKRLRALVLVCAVLGPVAGLLILRPKGGTYAYARYLIGALPFMLMLVAWALVELVCLLCRANRLTSRIALFAGVVLVVAAWLTGPVGLNAAGDGQFGNTYLSMMPLPAFDVPWDQTPGFYTSLSCTSRRLRIIETPEMPAKSLLLIRNYYLQHGQDITVGFVRRLLGSQAEHLPSGPYVDLADPRWVANCNADYLVFHIDPAEEAKEYWGFVYYKVWPAMKDPAIQSLMRSQMRLIARPGRLKELARGFQRQLGKPVYEDKWIVVWKLRSKQGDRVE